MDLITLGILLAIAYCTGTYSEKRHLASIRERERNTPKIPVLNTEKDIPAEGIARTALVFGSTVVGVDYFRFMLGGLINLFGGRIGIYESALDRARREALLRMRHEAQGAEFIGNVRYETCILSQNTRKQGLPTVSIMAYGTAFYTTAAPVSARPYLNAFPT